MFELVCSVFCLCMHVHVRMCAHVHVLVCMGVYLSVCVHVRALADEIVVEYPHFAVPILYMIY